MFKRYFESITQSPIAILATCPPLLGGISVHAQRVGAFLNAQSHQVFFFDIEHEYQKHTIFTYFGKLIAFLWRTRPKIIHYHGMTLHRHLIEPYIIFAYLFITDASLVIIHHSSRFVCARGKWYRFFLNRLTSFRLVTTVYIGENTEFELYNWGLKNNSRSSVESPFLPPTIHNKNKLMMQYPSNLMLFLQTHKPIIVVNATRCVQWNNVDLYGIDMVIKLLEDLQSRGYEKIGVVCAIASINDEAYWNILYRQIQENVGFYCLFNEQRELWPLIASADLFVRPTSSDTISICIDEALYLGIPVVASDVCVRQKGVITFRSRDHDDFLKKTLLVLNERS